MYILLKFNQILKKTVVLIIRYIGEWVLLKAQLRTVILIWIHAQRCTVAKKANHHWIFCLLLSHLSFGINIINFWPWPWLQRKKIQLTEIKTNFIMVLWVVILSITDKFLETRVKLAFLSLSYYYSVVSIKRTGCNKWTGWSKNFI